MGRRALLMALLTLGLGVGSPPTPGASYVPMADADLLAQSPVVVIATPQSRQPQLRNGWPITRHQVVVVRSLKGQAPPTLEVETLGHPPGAGGSTPGAALLSPGLEHILFLEPRNSGRYGVVHLALGAFFAATDPSGRRAAVRDLRGMHPTQNAGLARRYGEARDFAAFAAWIEAQTQHPSPKSVGAEDYWIPFSEFYRHQPTAKFNLLTPLLRWFDFDRGDAVTWYATSHGKAGLPGGGFAEFQGGLEAWNADPDSHIELLYGGTVEAHRTSDDNVVYLDDPFDDIAGSYNCSSGGVLAVASAISQGARQTYDGRSFEAIARARIITQDGAGCAFAERGNSTAAEVFAHELGHTLGLDHACGDSRSGFCVPDSLADRALMRAFVHGDGRGAALGDDDRSAAANLYALHGGPGDPGPPLPTPADVTASDGEVSSGVLIVWRPVLDADDYQVWRHIDDDFTAAKVLGTTATNAFEDTTAQVGVEYFYWVVARSSAGSSEPGGPDGGLRGLMAPSGVAAADGTSTSGIRVTWERVAEAQGYTVWRGPQSPDPGVDNGPDLADADLLAQVGSRLYYQDNAAVPGVAHYYWVASRRGELESSPSAPDGGHVALEAPDDVTASDGTWGGRIALTWTTVAGASHYGVFRGTSSSANAMELLGTTEGLAWDDFAVEGGQRYYYRVVALSVVAESPFSAADSGRARADGALFSDGFESP
ncbi:MAG: M12 family metallo-peptidase [Candidatus Competibacterales bacterium]